MGLYALLIVNKSGGLVFHKQLSPSSGTLGTNELLRIGSTFHGLYAITRYCRLSSRWVTRPVR